MAAFFDEAKWRDAVRRPDWYIQLYPEIKELQQRWETEADKSIARAMKNEVREFFEAALLAGTIKLAGSGQNLDAERQPIDEIIIHHTSAEPGYTLPRMNAVQMLSVYVPYFNNPTNESEKSLRGAPLWSNHARDGQPVFYLYHWLMRMDGGFERLLEDHELGWHAANWDVNRRSVAICLDNNYEDQNPAPDLLQKLADFIAKEYPQIKADNVKGHSEVSRKGTVCPGKNFVSEWKHQLTWLVGEAQQLRS